MIQDITLIDIYEEIPTDKWEDKLLYDVTIGFCIAAKKDKKKLTQILRAALTGQLIGPPLFKFMEIIGKDESINRLNNALSSVD